MALTTSISVLIISWNSYILTHLYKKLAILNFISTQKEREPKLFFIVSFQL